MSQTYLAVEFHADTIEETGAVETYMADSLKDAVHKVLYTKQLKNGNARIGPSGSVVHAGKTAWSVVIEKKVGSSHATA